MNSLVFDIETVPDVAGGRLLYQLEDLDDKNLGRAMFHKRAEESGGSEFLRHHLHRIVAISVVLKSGDRFKVWSLGEPDAPGIETELAIHAHGLPHRWSTEVDREVQTFGPRVPLAAKKDRVDLRDVPLVTIDGEDAKDFDDAVFAEKIRGGWRVLVAIADVSHYVRLGTALDEEAQERGTSVYFPTRAVPMLPEELSNGLCSLKPKVDRLCMVCEMQVDGQGKVTRSEFYEAVMRSKARFSLTLCSRSCRCVSSRR